jgi:hypothetical protein
MGKRITRMELDGKPLDPAKSYKVAGWAPVSEEAKGAGGEAIWDVCARYLRAQKVVAPRKLNVPKIEGKCREILAIALNRLLGLDSDDCARLALSAGLSATSEIVDPRTFRFGRPIRASVPETARTSCRMEGPPRLAEGPSMCCGSSSSGRERIVRKDELLEHQLCVARTGSGGENNVQV